jgi:hypothetical protein
MFNVFISMTNSGRIRAECSFKLSPKTVLACVSLNLRVTRIRVNGTVLYVFMDSDCHREFTSTVWV